jgi:hypothetical protein
MRANWSEFSGRARAFKSLVPRQGQQRMDPAARDFAGMNPMFTTRIVAQTRHYWLQLPVAAAHDYVCLCEQLAAIPVKHPILREGHGPGDYRFWSDPLKSSFR